MCIRSVIYFVAPTSSTIPWYIYQMVTQGTHVRRNLFFCLGHLINTRPVTNQIFSLQKDVFSFMHGQHVQSYHLIRVPCTIPPTTSDRIGSARVYYARERKQGQGNHFHLTNRSISISFNRRRTSEEECTAGGLSDENSLCALKRLFSEMRKIPSIPLSRSLSQNVTGRQRWCIRIYTKWVYKDHRG